MHHAAAMKVFQHFWTNLRSSLWFIPSLMVVGAMGLAVLLLEVGAAIEVDLDERWPRLFGAGEDGSRELLGAIAMSTITVTGVVFSITVLMLSQASAQYTPRVLRNFMASRAVQVVLGMFAGIFAYCLVVLRTIRGGDDPTVHPLAVFGGMVLALVGVGFLIFFIHHIASSLQASTIIDDADTATRRAIDALFPDELGEGVDEEVAPAVPSGLRWVPVPATGSGYLQRVDTEGLLEFTRQHTVILRMDRGMGEFVVEGLPLASIAGREPQEEHVKAINQMFFVDSFRTVDQDAAFGLRQIVDIALKALSPSLNDVTTAVMCVDHLSALLSRLARRRIEPRVRGERADQPRVIAKGPTFESLLDEALDQIRRNAGSKVAVLVRLVWCIEVVASSTSSARRRQALTYHLRLLVPPVEQLEPLRDRPLLEQHMRRAAGRLGLTLEQLKTLEVEALRPADRLIMPESSSD